jgi:broad specificity phosphatase PhoE
MKLVLIRHGEIDSNVAKIYSGRSSEPLNENGRVQAQVAAERLQGLDIDVLLTSPLRRAMETSTIIGEKISCTPIISEAFTELGMGPWEGLSELEVAKRYPIEFGIWNTAPADLSIPGRETLEELQKRALSGLVDVGRSHNGGFTAIVSHVAVIRVLVLHATSRPLNDYKKIDVPNAYPLLLNLDKGGFVK